MPRMYRSCSPVRRSRMPKAIGETAQFLKEQGKIEAVLPDYAPYVSAKFIQ
ncbi:hypothetical protein PS652_05174 [Pseudomonas fluorescens]|uniref:Uncharacterized protein n=1 Tax=Pseudomonas fluorescens TaxID=294 RepID=A0A5E6SW39_PSEFL|nr:hypothetical protein PS652_02468 [Pseudomonas fluorescens]